MATYEVLGDEANNTETLQTAGYSAKKKNLWVSLSSGDSTQDQYVELEESQYKVEDEETGEKTEDADLEAETLQALADQWEADNL